MKTERENCAIRKMRSMESTQKGGRGRGLGANELKWFH